MSVFVIGDTHLSLGCDKPMDKFGQRWKNHTDRIYENWCREVTDNDTVLIAGDLSWGINLEEALPDFRFIDALPGKKILLKGNHDYWWDTVTKMNAFFEANGITTLSFLHNSAVRCEDFILCGSRGWYNEDKKVITQNDVDSTKLIAREVGRIRMSLDAGIALREAVQAQEGISPELLVFLHFPPYFKGYICDEIILELYRYGIERCYFGHIHGVYDIPLTRRYMDIDFTFVSGDFLNFTPLKITKA